MLVPSLGLLCAGNARYFAVFQAFPTFDSSSSWVANVDALSLAGAEQPNHMSGVRNMHKVVLILSIAEDNGDITTYKATLVPGEMICSINE